MAMPNWLLRYSAAVCRRPRLVIASCVVATLTCSLGLFRVNIITNPDLIWVPPNSLANRQKAFFDDAFDPFFRVNQVFFVAEEPEADMVAERYLQRVMGVQRAIESANFTAGGEVQGFDSLCFKPIDGEGCLVESPSQYWVGDPIVLAGDPSPSLTAACQTSDAFLASRSPCMDEIGTPVMRGVVFGDIGVNAQVASPDPCGGSVPTAGALVLTFLLNNFRDPEYQRLAEKWEKEVFLAVVEEARGLLENDVQAPMKVSFMAQRSVADSLSVEAGENAWVLIVSYLCMFLYVSLILGNPCHVIRSRYSLALTGIAIVVASLMTTIGLLSMAGVGTTLIVWEVVPFLTLAIGVDNMVILSREFDRLETTPEFEAATSSSHNNNNNKGGDAYASEGASATGPTFSWASTSSVLDRGREDKEAADQRLEDRMGAAVSKVAPSILGAAVCEAVAFLVGALTDIPALRQFCLVAATAVLVGFVLQISWFIAALSLDAKRVAQGRLDLAPWLIQAEDKDGYEWYSTRNSSDPMRALRAPLLGNGDRSSGRPGQRLQMFLRQFGSELVSPPRPRPRRRTSSGSTTSSGNNHNHSHSHTRNAHSGNAPGGMGWSSPRSSRGRGGGGGGGDGGGRNGLLRVNTRLSDDDEDDGDEEFLDALGNSVRDQRDLTAEFGSGSEANPALFASSTRRGSAAPAPEDGGPAAGIVSRRRGGGGGGLDEAGRGARAALARGGRRKWVEENRSSDGESAIEELARTRAGVDVRGEGEEAKGSNMSSFSSPSSPSLLGEGSVGVSVSGSVGLASVAGGSTSGGHGRPSGDTHGRENDFRHTSSSGRGRGRGRGGHGDGHGHGDGAVGGQVVDGYVSLGSHHQNPQQQQQQQQRRRQQRRWGAEDDRGGGLLLPAAAAAVPTEAQDIGARGGGAGAGQALSVFREQLYEEGRGRGGKGGNLASRLLERHYLPALFSQGGTMCTLAGAAVLAILGLAGLANLQMGLEPQLAAPTDFYLQDYYDAQFSKGEAGPPAYVVFGDVDYFEAYDDEGVRDAFRGVSTGLAQLQRYVQAPIYSWFDTMVGWVHQKDTLVSDCPAQTEITDEASFYGMVEVFLSIPIESQCCQSYGVCGAQFESDVTFDDGDEDGIRRIKASRLRFNMQPLTTQRDFVNSYYYVKVATEMLADKLPERYEGQRKAKANKAVGNLAFPYSLYFVFYEQYAFIQGVALQNILLALAVVFLSIAFLSGFALAALVSSLVLGTTLGTVGLVWMWGVLSSAPYAVSINAVSVCNLVMSLGLSVEFCLHVAVAFQNVPGTRQERAEAAMKSAGASVLTGITLTKLVGVSVLAIAPSLLFRVYYFRMYMATVAVGAFQGLAVLPVLLSMWGPDPPPSSIHLPGCSSWAGGDSWCEDDETDELSRSRKGGYCDLGGGGTPPSRNPLALGWNRGRGGAGALWDGWGDKEDLPVEGPPLHTTAGHHTARPTSLFAGAKEGVRVRESYVSLGSGTPKSAVSPSERDPGVGVAAAREREETARARGSSAQEQEPPFSDPGAEAVAARGLGARGEGEGEGQDEAEPHRQRRSNSTATGTRSRGSLGRRTSSGYSSRAKPLTQYSPW